MSYTTVYTLAQIIDRIDSTWHWSGTSRTFSFAASAPAYSLGEEVPDGFHFSAFVSTQQAMARTALALYADVINMTFTEVAAGAGEISFQNSTDAGYAWANFPWTGSGGDVWINPAYGPSSGTNNLVSPVMGQWGYSSYLHEIGHAMGLNHPGDYNGGSPTYTANALYQQDTLQYTLMSYFSASNTGADHFYTTNQYAETLLLHDIATLQAIYGANTTTRTGNTTYGFNSNAGVSAYDFSSNPDPVICIWDAGGTDTLDFSGFTSGTVLSLLEGAFSNTQDMTSNVSIAFGAVIENAFGGSGSDGITGNGIANSLSGGLGNDTMTGGAGDDTLAGGGGTDQALFSGALSNFSFAYSAAGDMWVVTDGRTTGSEGTDYLQQMENCSFSDATGAISSTGSEARLAMSKTDGSSWTRVYDTDNSQAHSQYTNLYTAGYGSQTTQSGSYDAGGSWFAQWDLAGAQTWTSYTSNYNASGQQTAQVGNYDDGSHWVSAWDLASTESWIDNTTNYDSSWRQVLQVGNYDNGNHWVSEWDAAGAQSWSSRTTNYNAAWAELMQVQTNDDSTFTVTTHDVAAAQDWIHIIQNYNSSWGLLNTTTYYDNGAIVTV